MAKEFFASSAAGPVGLKRITSWSVQETAGLPAVIKLKVFDGSGITVLAVNLTAGESCGDSLGEDAWQSEQGFHLDIVAGSVLFSCAGAKSV